MIKTSRPVLRWHGGKWILAPWIISHFPPHRVYTEVYGGAASVLMRKPRAYCEVYNDLDGEVVNLFRVLRDPVLGPRLIHSLLATPFAREEFNLSYQPIGDPLERARRLVVVSFMGFGSNGHNTDIKTGFRANSNRSGTTPSHDWAHYPESLGATIERLRGVVIESKPAVEVLAQQDCLDALHYVDPPYVASTRNPGKDYRFEMDESEHRSLAVVLNGLLGGVILSGYPSPLYEELYAGWHRVEKNSLADGARKRTEVLWINDSAWAAADGRLI